MIPARTPVVVVGAGLGGLATAIELAPRPVLLVTRARLGEDVASAWAQGGLAAAVGDDDSPGEHAADTHAAGDGLCDPAVVTLVTEAAPACVERLRRLGVGFDADADGRPLLGREGGHHRRRILHVRDATGAAITRALVAELRRTPSVTVLEGVDVEDLLLRDGAVAGLTARRGAERLRISASAVVLATGGLGGLYARTSNPLGARGDGLAMAARAGAQLADLEFVQFHPTALDLGADPMPLATEALRGEGAVLVNSLGERFMQGLHPLADLAPRDVVARAIFRERAAGRGVFLDAREALGDRFAGRFPTVYAACRQAGLDPATQPMPVAPAAHYHMGGIAVDETARSSVPGLWAVGEVAATGLHGANRLASNSLLEALVFGERAARDIAARAASSATLAPPAVADRRPAAEDAYTLDWLRRTMDAEVGVERDAAGLGRAVAALAPLAAGEGAGPVLRNAATAALLVATAALAREESRGGHFRRDHPAHAPGPARRGHLTLREAFDRAAAMSPPPMARAAAG
ncbi:MAG: L-aspartate oxidase [Steroidobacteraceae bacterium]|nr:L-aspartate oxidase [Steroidobacteraceae bacterium]